MATSMGKLRQPLKLTARIAMVRRSNTQHSLLLDPQPDQGAWISERFAHKMVGGDSNGVMESYFNALHFFRIRSGK